MPWRLVLLVHLGFESDARLSVYFLSKTLQSAFFVECRLVKLIGTSLVPVRKVRQAEDSGKTRCALRALGFTDLNLDLGIFRLIRLENLHQGIKLLRP